MLMKYSEDQPRDDDGKFASGGGDGISRSDVPNDRQEAITFHFSAGEKFQEQYLKSMFSDSGVSREDHQKFHDLARAHNEASEAVRVHGIDSPQYEEAFSKIKSLGG